MCQDRTGWHPSEKQVQAETGRKQGGMVWCLELALVCSTGLAAWFELGFCVLVEQQQQIFEGHWHDTCFLVGVGL